MEFDDEVVTTLYIKIQDNPELNINDAIKIVRVTHSLRDAIFTLFVIVTEQLDYKEDDKVALFLKRLVSLESMKLKLPTDFPEKFKD